MDDKQKQQETAKGPFKKPVRSFTTRESMSLPGFGFGDTFTSGQAGSNLLVTFFVPSWQVLEVEIHRNGKTEPTRHIPIAALKEFT